MSWEERMTERAAARAAARAPEQSPTTTTVTWADLHPGEPEPPEPVEPPGGWPPAPMASHDTFAEWLQEEVHRVALAGHALEDMALVPVLAAHPWALHWLAAQPEWATYVAHVRAGG